MEKTSDKPAKQLSRQDWLEAARVALSQKGVQGVKVEVLARHLGVSKGSFYWHFKNRDELLLELLDYWEQNTEWLIQNLPKQRSPKAQLKHLFAAIGELGVTGEDSIHTWAKHDKALAERLKRVESRRLEFLTGLFQEQGFAKKEAQARAEICYVAFLGYVFKAGQDSTFKQPISSLGNKLTDLLM